MSEKGHFSTEENRIERLAACFGTASPPPGVLVSIGDDAAVLLPGRTSMVWTVDASVERVHFRREWLSFADIGYRSLMAAASDLAAMGARPRGVLSSLVLPRDVTDAELDELASGQKAAAEQLGTAVIGGNLARGTELSITTTVLGEAERPLRRTGAVPGDVVALAGTVGLARAGLLALLDGRVTDEPALHDALVAWKRPRALLAEGLAAAKSAHAAIDLSDGLQLDAWRLARASGVRLVLRAEAVSEAGGAGLARAARILGQSPLDLALIGGEDYAVLATFPAADLPTPFFPIGICTEGNGIALELASGDLHDLRGEGYDHFAS